MVIDTLLGTYGNSAPVVYFYCNYKEPARQQEWSILRTLYRDLCVLKGIDDNLSSISRFKTPVTTSLPLYETKQSLCALASTFPMVFLVLDALDECDEDDRISMITFLVDELPQSTAVKLFFASRREPDLHEILSTQGKLSYEIDANDTAKDIRPFVERRVQKMVDSKALLKGNIAEDLKREIIDALCRSAHGM